MQRWSRTSTKKKENTRRCRNDSSIIQQTNQSSTMKRHGRCIAGRWQYAKDSCVHPQSHSNVPCHRSQRRRQCHGTCHTNSPDVQLSPISSIDIRRIEANRIDAFSPVLDAARLKVAKNQRTCVVHKKGQSLCQNWFGAIARANRYEAGMLQSGEMIDACIQVDVVLSNAALRLLRKRAEEYRSSISPDEERRVWLRKFAAVH